MPLSNRLYSNRRTGATPNYIWRVQDLPPGAGGTVTITGVISDVLAESTFINSASIAVQAMEANMANNRDVAEVTVWVHRIRLPLVLRDY